ncbi:MAG: hypothetical protein II467_05510 [Bacilli bacterium]|nr:hypothetical protein [Bacilli bacterium]
MRIKIHKKGRPTFRLALPAGMIAFFLKRESPGLSRAIRNLKKNKKRIKQQLKGEPLIQVISKEGDVVEIRL